MEIFATYGIEVYRFLLSKKKPEKKLTMSLNYLIYIKLYRCLILSVFTTSYFTDTVDFI